MYNTDNISIVLSTDNNYAPYAAATIASICDNTKSFCKIYILDGGISEVNKNRISELKTYFDNLSVSFIIIDTERYFKNFQVKIKHITISTYYRFLIGDLFPDIDKILYLDADIIANKDVKQLYDIDLQEYIIGAVKDRGNTEYINKLKENVNINYSHNYFNAGVLLIDLKKWREKFVTKKLFEIEKEYRGNLLCNDQDVLNKYFENNYLVLETKYNAWFYSDKNVILRHYYSIPKPWEIRPKLCIFKFNDYKKFWFYLKKTPFYEEIYENCHYKSYLQMLAIFIKTLRIKQNIIYFIYIILLKLGIKDIVKKILQNLGYKFDE